jgi:hypothetical protein
VALWFKYFKLVHYLKTLPTSILIKRVFSQTVGSKHKYMRRHWVTISLFFLVIPVSVFSQEKEEKLVGIMKSPDGIMYTDNTPGAYFCIDFKGDTITNTGIENGFKIDDHIFQVIRSRFSLSEYNFNKDDSARESELLKGKMRSELDYISKEVLKKEVVSDYEVFKNKDGKNYFLWHYKAPAMPRKNADDILVTHHFFLTFVANQHVIGVAMPLFENENLAERKNVLKQLADRIDVMGAKIDVDGLYYKLDAQGEGKNLEYVDSLNGYSLTIKEWFNITQSPAEEAYIGTLPDVDNIQNAILVRRFKKEDFSSFSEFNDKLVPPHLKVGDKFGTGTFLLKQEMPDPPQPKGLNCMIQVMRNSIFHQQYVTLETPRCYLAVIFTATPKTFHLNQPRFLEFVKDIEMIK